MKQVTQNYKTGKIRVDNVLSPALKPGGILVRTHYSVVSTGTEGMKVREAKLSLLGKARARPDQLQKVLGTLRQQGLAATYQKVMNKLDSLTPLGYSLAGEVIAVGRSAEEFHIGQYVACAGAGYANHAEVNFVPSNLAVPIPSDVSLKHAAFATVGSIALHGFRQAQLQLGEFACVIGLGLLGQLLVQILKAGGVQVIGIDLVEARCLLATQLGATAAFHPENPDLHHAVQRITGGHGADCVFIAAGGPSNLSTELAAQLARDRGSVVDIGKTRLDLPWNEFYLKELNVRFSRSYGPGRYDPEYEEHGIDYPYGYVRWTERRNLAAFLSLVANGQVRIDPIISDVRPFSEAEQVYQEIAEGKTKALGIVFEYREPPSTVTPCLSVKRTESRFSTRGKLRIGVIGAGNYASSMLLPHLKRDRDVDLIGVATTTSLSAQNAVRKFGFRYATTDYEELLTDSEIDAVIIATRHSSHARLAAQALRNNKAVYVEKPLALTLEETALLHSTVLETNNDRLMVGFNRRFSPMIQTLLDWLPPVEASPPFVMNYRVHAGQLERGAWYLNHTEGTRFVGEAGHFFDLLALFARSRPIAVTATALRPPRTTPDDLENIVAAVRYDNGTIGNLLYLTQGHPEVPKEHLEMFGAGRTAQLSNFEMLTLYQANSSLKKIKARRINKGQEEELKAFVHAVKNGKAMPIPIDTIFDTTLTTFAAAKAARDGTTVLLSDFWC